MANRSYLYSLDNRPAAYDDRPTRISGLGEWPYDVPFSFRLLMSDDPRLCVSLVADGLDADDDGDDPDITGAEGGTAGRVPLHAISSVFDGGFARMVRFVDIVRRAAALADPPQVPTPAEVSAPVPWAVQWWRRLLRPGPRPADAASAMATAAAAPPSLEHLPGWLDETLAFLQRHRNGYLLLETVELDTMSESTEAGLQQCVLDEIDRCRAAGAAVDALPVDPDEAARVLRQAAREPLPAPLDAFFGLRFDDDCDNSRSRQRLADQPLGLQWSDVLYFDLYDRAQFEAAQRETGNA